MPQRRRFEQSQSLTERLNREAARLRAQAGKLPHGPEQDRLTREARQAETATHILEWLSSPGLQAPL